MQQITLSVETNNLATGTETGIDGEYPLLSQWRSEKKLAEVFGEYANCLIVGFLFGLGGKFCFNGRLEQPFVSIRRGFVHLSATFVVATYELAFQTFDARLVVRSDGHFQQPFGFGTADGKQAMGSAAFQRFGKVEIVPVFGGLFFFAFNYFSVDFRLAAELIADSITGTFVFAHLLGDNVAGTFQSILCVFDIAFDERRNTGAQVVLALHHQ